MTAHQTCRAVAEEMLALVAAGWPIKVAATLCTRRGAPGPGAGKGSPGRPEAKHG